MKTPLLAGQLIALITVLLPISVGRATDFEIVSFTPKTASADERCTKVNVGCGSGPSTVALAQMVGGSGRVIAADVQPAMLAKVEKRVARLSRAALLAKAS